MESRAGRTWIIDAFVYFLPVLFLWVMATLWVGSSLEAKINFLESIQTHLLADYSPDYLNQSFKSLKLAIFGDVFSDSAIPPDAMSTLEIVLQDPVPTATKVKGMVENTSTPILTVTVEPLATATFHPTKTPNGSPEKTQEPVFTPTEKTAIPTPTATHKRESIIPILECVAESGDGSFTAYFGYVNPNAYQVEIPLGEKNKFAPAPIDRGQPTIFLTGTTPTYPDTDIQVVFDGEPLIWHLDGHSATASKEATPCETIAPEEADTQPPQISEGNPDPPPGDLDVCSTTITVDDLRVVDPAPSSGIAWVKLKYNVEGYTSGYIYSNPMTLCSGGPTDEGGWDGCYSGAIVVEMDPAWRSPEPEPFKINLYAKAQDNDGNNTCYFIGQYTMPSSCGTYE